MRLAPKCLLAVVAMLLLSVREAGAQYRAPVGVVHESAPADSAPVRERVTQQSRGESAISGAIIGVVSGAALGGIVAFAATHRSYSDHGGDVVVYAVFVPLGGIVGLLTGSIIGAAIAH